MKNSKVIIFSHAIDLDGMGAVVLAKLAFVQVDYVLCSRCLLKPQDALTRYLDSGRLIDYDHVIVCDVYPLRRVLKRISADTRLANRFYWFDHHAISAEAAKEFSGAGLLPHLFVRLESDHCATSLFYEWLIDQKLLQHSQALDDFVSQTCIADTGRCGPHCAVIAAGDLKQEFRRIGPGCYIERWYDKLRRTCYNN